MLRDDKFDTTSGFQEIYHATTLENAKNIFTEKRFLLFPLHDNGKVLYGFFGTLTPGAAEAWGYQLLYEKQEDPPPAVIIITLANDIIEDIIDDPLALARKVGDSIFVIIKEEYVQNKESSPFLSIDGSKVNVDLFLPVNIEEFLQSILLSLRRSAAGGWEGQDFYSDEERLLLDNDKYAYLKAQEIALERLDEWLSLKDIDPKLINVNENDEQIIQELRSRKNIILNEIEQIENEMADAAEPIGEDYVPDEVFPPEGIDTDNEDTEEISLLRTKILLYKSIFKKD